jgi:hypothetical protein
MRIVIAILLTLFSCSATAVKYRSLGISLRVSSSDFIAIAKTERVGNDYYSDSGAHQIYADIRIVSAIKGISVGSSLKFITDGLTPDFDPNCCSLNKNYLIFGKFGYPVLESDSDMDTFVLKERTRFVTSADGRYGVFEVVNGVVKKWRADGDDEELSDVLMIIKSELWKKAP